jgi:ATP-dependent Clp protease ATP-binding subunit ClpA
MSNELNTIFVESEKIAERNKDQYITEEHLLLALIDYSTQDIQEIFSAF